MPIWIGWGEALLYISARFHFAKISPSPSISVFPWKIISLQPITTALQKQQAFLRKARTTPALLGKEEQISRFLSRFPLPPCGILLLPPALSSLPFPLEVRLLSSLHLQIFQWPVSTWVPSSNRENTDLGWRWLKAHSFYSSFQILLKRSKRTSWVFPKSSSLQVCTTE